MQPKELIWEERPQAIYGLVGKYIMFSVNEVEGMEAFSLLCVIPGLRIGNFATAYHAQYAAEQIYYDFVSEIMQGTVTN